MRARRPAAGSPLTGKSLEEALLERLEACRRDVEAAAARAGRSPGSVRLLAVTKYVDLDFVRALHALGVRDFGESTVQRLVAMARGLEDLGGARWHLVGHLQRNKAQRALETARVIHSVDSLRLARELAARWRSGSASRADSPEGRGGSEPQPGPGHGAPGPAGPGVALLIEANISAEPRKTGASVEETRSILALLRDEGLLHPPPREPGWGTGVRGLMTMAPLVDGASSRDAARRAFSGLRALREELLGEGLLPPDAELSMGMSGDLEVAVEEGATVVRVGSRLYEGLIPGH